MKLSPIEVLTVYYAPEQGRRRRVGRLASKGRRILFEYDPAFLASGLELSPFKLRLKRGVLRGEPDKFDGLMGVFEDSLPDGWGRRLLDRRIAQEGLMPEDLGPLDRLAWVGARSMGALVYEPELGGQTPTVIQLRKVAEETQRVLHDVEGPDLDRLLMLGGSPQGARPKALVQIGADPKVVYGADEILTRMLGRTKKHRGYFGIRRFDRAGPRRIHLHTFCGLMHAPPATTSVTYRDLLLATRELTRDESMVTEMFRRACFNVFAHNRDDHTKNFSFLMDEDGTWRVSPAYDLTFSRGPGGEHTLLVGTEGKNPTAEHLRALARDLDIKRTAAVIDAVRAGIDRFRELADEAELPAKVRERVAKAIGLAPRRRAH